MSELKPLSAAQNRIVDAGVLNLKQFGYPSVNADNIFTDRVFRELFVGMLKDNLGRGADAELNDLIARCDPASAKGDA